MKVGGVGTPGEVRFIGSGDLDAVTTTNSLGAFTLGIRAAGTYTPLLIPSAPTLAPHRGRRSRAPCWRRPASTSPPARP